jgi:hypothetical protein
MKTQEADRNALENDLEKWCTGLLDMDFMVEYLRFKELHY